MALLRLCECCGGKREFHVVGLIIGEDRGCKSISAAFFFSRHLGTYVYSIMADSLSKSICGSHVSRPASADSTVI